MKRVLLLAALSLAAVACGTNGVPSSARSTFVLASTTSTQDSGLLDALTAEFEKGQQWRAKVVAVGSGEALDLGRRGDADVLLVHSPEGEQRFMDEGHGVFRKPVMRNDFVIVGPRDDAAAIRGGTSALEAFKKIAEKQSFFVSRGDESGTHTRELKTWKSTGVKPGGPWYSETGQGMAETLIVASETNAYTLTDTATLDVMKSKIKLDVLVRGDRLLVNPYSVIPVREARQPEAARAFAEWITSRPGQEFIGEFGRSRYGAPLFVPTANS